MLIASAFLGIAGVMSELYDALEWLMFWGIYRVVYCLLLDHHARLESNEGIAKNTGWCGLKFKS